ncbi:MAG: lipoyl synthase [Deltaproteobacteria bacterium]|nr:lipoyl synthase [Deltaproteobacteria bacterium]
MTFALKESGAQHPRHPEWVKVRAPRGELFEKTRQVLQQQGLHTICREAACPNIGECWGHRSASFLILGPICTRKCAFCHVDHGRPQPIDPTEPERLAKAVAELQMRHLVVTSVDRDDLPDGGASHFVRVAEAIKMAAPQCSVEFLIPDFKGDVEAVRRVTKAPVEIIGHNIETVSRLYRTVRRGSDYERSLEVLRFIKELNPRIKTKTGLMLGLGEEIEEVQAVWSDLRGVGCDILTLGQYLQPSREELPVVRYVPPQEFISLREEALRLGFSHVESGTFVRSSYRSWEQVMEQAREPVL